MEACNASLGFSFDHALMASAFAFLFGNADQNEAKPESAGETTRLPLRGWALEMARRWNGGSVVGALLLPEAADLPVLVGVRMSLSFPGLFAAVPLYTRDFELPSIVRQLGGKPARKNLP